MRLSFSKALALAVVVGFTTMGCKKGGNQPAKALTQSMKKTLGIQPNAVVSVNFQAIRKSPPMQDFMKKNRSKMVSFLKDSPMKSCNLNKLVDQLDGAVLMNFDNMNWTYVVLSGQFDANATLACVEKSSKTKVPSKTLHGKKVYLLQNNYMWVASKNSIVALAASPKTQAKLGPAKFKAEGKEGLLSKLIMGKGVLSQGSVGKMSSYALSFKVDGVNKIKMASKMRMPFKLPMPSSVWGNLTVNNNVLVNLSLELKSEEVAKSIKSSVAAFAVLLPDEFSNSLKFATKKNVMIVNFKHDTKKLVAFGKSFAAKQMKRFGGGVGGTKVKWKIRKAPTRALPIKPDNRAKPGQR